MTYSTFITSEYMYKHTQVDNNVDPGLIDASIIKAQDLQIQSVLGNALFIKLMGDISTDTLTGAYKTLVDEYVQKTTASWTLYYCLPWISQRLTNKSVSEKKSDTSTATDIKNVQWLREEVRIESEFLSTRIREFLCNNIANYPEYVSYLPNTIKPSRNNFFSGVYLPDYRKLTREERYKGLDGYDNYNDNY